MNRGEALVFKSTGSWYQLRDGLGRFWQARIRGRLKMDADIASTNPVAVGDMVRFEIENEADALALIQDIVPRRNYIVRVSPHNRNQKHIVAANLDAALIIATLAEPRSSNGFIDRFLVTAAAYHIPAIIVVNKLDLYDAGQMKQLATWQQAYAQAGYELFPVCAKAPDSIQSLRNRITGCTTLFSGHSGVGKSTLINTLLPSLALRTAEVSAWSGKGQHTTTFAEMFELPEGNSRIIDTPGVKEFGLLDFEREELSHYFPEMRVRLSDCRFNNCLHLEEPGCAIKAALEEGQISLMRYESYRTILASIEKKW